MLLLLLLYMRKPIFPLLSKYRLVQWNWFSEVAGYTRLTHPVTSKNQLHCTSLYNRYISFWRYFINFLNLQKNKHLKTNGAWHVLLVHTQTVYKLICCNGTCPGQPKNATHTPKPTFYHDLSRQGDCNSFPPSLLPKYCHSPRETIEENPAKKKKSATVLLYNVAADPFEMENLAVKHADIVKKMMPMMPSGKCPAEEWF